MSFMLLQPISFERETKLSCWKCQLWPKTLWSGLDVDRLGHANNDFPSGEELNGRHDENIVFDCDLLVEENQLPTYADSESTQADEEPQVTAEIDQPVPMDWKLIRTNRQSLTSIQEINW